MQFKTSLDNTAIVVTLLITVLFAFIVGIEYYVAASSEGALYPVAATAVILLLIYCLAFAYRPAGYKITADALIICRLIANVHIERAAIQSIAIIDKKQLNTCVRTFGVGGLFGYYGSFANFKIGGMTWYATRRDKAVLITIANNKKIVVTPDDPEAFINALHT